MNGQHPDYRKMLDEFRKQRSALDQVISGLEVLVGESAATILNSGGVPTEIHPDTFTGKTIAEAAAIYLRGVGRPARTTDEISEALNRGGLAVLKESVSAILMRDANQGGEIYKVGRGVWGLSEWYPGAVKRGKRKASDKESSEEDQEKTSTEEGASNAS